MTDRLNLTDLEVDALFWSLRQPNQVTGKLKSALGRAFLKLEIEKYLRHRDKIYLTGFNLGKNGKNLKCGHLGSMESRTMQRGFDAGVKEAANETG